MPTSPNVDLNGNILPGKRFFLFTPSWSLNLKCSLKHLNMKLSLSLGSSWKYFCSQNYQTYQLLFHRSQAFWQLLLIGQKLLSFSFCFCINRQCFFRSQQCRYNQQQNRLVLSPNTRLICNGLHLDYVRSLVCLCIAYANKCIKTSQPHITNNNQFQRIFWVFNLSPIDFSSWFVPDMFLPI